MVWKRLVRKQQPVHARPVPRTHARGVMVPPPPPRKRRQRLSQLGQLRRSGTHTQEAA